MSLLLALVGGAAPSLILVVPWHPDDEEDGALELISQPTAFIDFEASVFSVDSIEFGDDGDDAIYGLDALASWFPDDPVVISEWIVRARRRGRR